MTKTKNFDLHQWSGFEEEIKDTLKGFSDAFSIIDSEIIVHINDINDLPSGEVYPSNLKFYSNSPANIGFIGWVNLRGGVHYPKWKNDRLYSVGDRIIPATDNGYFYECISNGASHILEPSFSTESDSVSVDNFGSMVWESYRTYDVGDTVIRRSLDNEYYFKCTQKGTSGLGEPSWSTNVGGSIQDGSVFWVVYKTVKWKLIGESTNFTPFGVVGNTFEEVRKVIGATTKKVVYIGDAINKSFTISHDLEDMEVIVQIVDVATGRVVNTSIIEIVDHSTIKIFTPESIALNGYRVVIIS